MSTNYQVLTHSLNSTQLTYSLNSTRLTYSLNSTQLDSLTHSLTSLVSGSFVLELDRNKTHNIALQWKKVGTRISKWMISENNVGGIGHSLSAIANNENLW